MQNRPIRVLVVDDSALVRKIITDSLAHDTEIQVVGTAVDPYIARDKILQLDPDVITLDIEMPRMDGITFLKLIMKHRPMPVIILSSLTQDGSRKAMEALQAGAVEVMGKPSGSFSAYEDGSRLAEKIKAASHARIRRIDSEPAPAPVIKAQPMSVGVSSTGQASAVGAHQSATTYSAAARPAPTPANSTSSPMVSTAIRGQNRRYSSRQLILLGASTGGTEALKNVLTALPADMPGICIVQHIPAYFSLAFANRLNELCAFEVREAKTGDVVHPGLALVAPGGFHMLIKWVGGQYVIELNDGPMVHHQRPAVDVMFDSAVKAGAAPHSMSALLTGMGSDGAAGMLKLRQSGSHTIAQNEESCVVFGMPREAIKLGAAQQVLSLQQISARINHYASEVALSGQ
jgi:two-component system chemotaxis response regulator CheB